jgi:hypothetical protein
VGVGGAIPPESYAEYMERFEASYTMPATGEIAEAQEARNALRAGPRLPSGTGTIDVTLSPRFCGLPYESGPDGFDCSPEDPLAYDAQWMLNCCALIIRPRPPAGTVPGSAHTWALPCSQTTCLPRR